jgi:replicative superfamily II helicase
MSIMASGMGRTREELETFFSRTFMGLSESKETIRKNVGKALQLLLENGFVEQDRRGELSASTPGNVAASKRITCLMALDLALFLKEVGDRKLTDPEILYAIASSRDGKRIYIQIAQHEHRNRKYEQLVKEKFTGKQEYLVRFLPRSSPPNATFSSATSIP